MYIYCILSILYCASNNFICTEILYNDFTREINQLSSLIDTKFIQEIDLQYFIPCDTSYSYFFSDVSISLVDLSKKKIYRNVDCQSLRIIIYNKVSVSKFFCFIDIEIVDIKAFNGHMFYQIIVFVSKKILCKFTNFIRDKLHINILNTTEYGLLYGFNLQPALKYICITTDSDNIFYKYQSGNVLEGNVYELDFVRRKLHKHDNYVYLTEIIAITENEIVEIDEYSVRRFDRALKVFIAWNKTTRASKNINLSKKKIVLKNARKKRFINAVRSITRKK